MSNRTRPGQAFAGAAIEVAGRLVTRGCSISLRWVSAHKGVGGNEMGVFAKVGVEDACDSVG